MSSASAVSQAAAASAAAVVALTHEAVLARIRQKPADYVEPRVGRQYQAELPPCLPASASATPAVRGSAILPDAASFEERVVAAQSVLHAGASVKESVAASFLEEVREAVLPLARYLSILFRLLVSLRESLADASNDLLLLIAFFALFFAVWRHTEAPAAAIPLIWRARASRPRWSGGRSPACGSAWLRWRGRDGPRCPGASDDVCRGTNIFIDIGC